MELEPLYKRLQRGAWLFQHVGTQQEGTIHEPGCRASPNNESAGYFDLGLPSFQNCKK
jgi:hypothetical protein